MNPSTLNHRPDGLRRLGLRVARRAVGLLSAGVVWAASPAWAHGDEDHGATPEASQPAARASATTPPLESAAPRRLPDGSVWVPKAVQRRLGVLTVLTQQQDHAVAVELNGRVVADPNAGGRVQASQSGRIEAGPKGLPVLGQKVSKGQVLAYLKPAASSLERGNQQAELADLDAQYAVAERKLRRYEQLEGAVPQKDIEAARDERRALQKRRQAIAASVSAPEALVAPVAGTVAASYVTLGQVVDSKDVLFDIVDTSRLVVEALVYDARQAQGLRQASASLPDGGAVALQWMGGGTQLREQAMPVWFRVARADAPLAVGQAIKVIAQTAQSVTGLAVPRMALTRNAAGETTVWVHTQPEQFAARVIRFEPLDADTVVVTSGLHAGDRVVTQAASLLAQVR